MFEFWLLLVLFVELIFVLVGNIDNLLLVEVIFNKIIKIMFNKKRKIIVFKK